MALVNHMLVWSSRSWMNGRPPSDKGARLRISHLNSKMNVVTSFGSVGTEALALIL
jgi:hypothetical protein